MELHESLYALGRSQGRELFNDADSFRGALDDYLDEESASTGDINLLVDAVRLGAFHAMSTMLDSGADADRAIADAGARLARDRGSADVGGAMWALAVLGYAIGKVSDAQVRTYRTRHASAPVQQPGGAATALPPVPQAGPAAPPVTQRPAATPSSPVWPGSGSNHGSGGAPPYPAPTPGQRSFDPPPVTQPPGGGQITAGPAFGASFPPPQPAKRKKSPLALVLVGLIALLAIVAGVVGAIALTGGEDKKDEPTVDDGDPPEELDLSHEAINERYSQLAGRITTGTGATECTAAETLPAGVDEKIECTVDTGTLVLTDYAGDSEIDAARIKAVNYDEGHLTNQVDSGYFTMFDPESVDDPKRPASIYWDSRAASQSALMTAKDGSDADALLSAWRATTPTVDEPKRIMSLELDALAESFGIVRCERIPTLYDGELEEAACFRRGKPVWIAQFQNPRDFRAYRGLAKRLAEEDDFLVNSYWWHTDDATKTEVGKIYGYVDESGNGVLYADDLECLCYFQAYDNGAGDPVAIWNSYFSVE